MRFRSTSLLALFALTVCLCGSALADRVVLKDGTVLEGTVIKTSTGYWVKGADGTRKVVADADVQKVDKGSGPLTPQTSGTTPGATPAPTLSHFSGNLGEAKRRADEVEAPLGAVAIWQQFIDSKPSADDLKVAKEEQAKWKKMADGKAERIKGRWVSGDERKEILEKAQTLTREALDLMHSNETLKSMKKLEEAQTVYPNSFPVNFWLGYLSMLGHKEDKAMGYFEQALRLRPNNPESLSNLGICLLIKKRDYQQAIVTMQRAAEQADTKEMAENLVTAINYCPPIVRKSDRVRQAEESAHLLAAKYGIGGASSNFIIIPLREQEKGKEAAEDPMAGGIWSGTGFFVASDGLILTNRHVVDGAKTLMVVMNGDQETSAEIVKIDDEQDLALIRIKTEGKSVSIVKLSPSDTPADGAECTVMGFPLVDRLGASIKVTRGIVSSETHDTLRPDVVIDAKVNPGNSGGPIIDRFGNVMAIISMKSRASTFEDSYGLGISSGRIRKFLGKSGRDLARGEDTGPGLSAEQIAARVKPATVLILSTR
jgi:S1-C subfamily serine protease